MALSTATSASAGESRIAGGDKKTWKPGEAGDQIIRNAVAEIFLLVVPAHVGEGQYGHRGFVR